MIVKLCFQSDAVVPASQGDWDVHCDGTVRNADAKTQLITADLSTLPFKISLKLETGDSVTIWRDSCADKQYRQLILVLRQWEIKQGAEAPC